MQTFSERRVLPARSPRLSLLVDDAANPLPVLVAGDGLALAVALVHLEDEGGFSGNVTPSAGRTVEASVSSRSFVMHPPGECRLVALPP